MSNKVEETYRGHRIKVGAVHVGCGDDPAYAAYVYGLDNKLWNNRNRQYEASQEKAFEKAKKRIDSMLDS